ncbi:TMV resistance protein N-like [Pyrus ussuriensis x Pyrus communis]|uniref:TMV resistance protein N-like n=1 Tax=Pyrus ussuriensis x Pyrus communis TaxID=2448454 RepID=A0A5N5GD41_9ROSA|nr:TMV resistance protein N-like [Pyrus ussuriensis x Pyrus communis]
MNNRSQIGILQETAIDTRAFTMMNSMMNSMTYMRLIPHLWKQVLTMYNCSAEEEIARWKAIAEEEAAVGTGVEQEFAAQATEAVESIILDLSFSKPKVVYFSSEAFVKMTKLRLLKIHGHNGYSCENLKFLLHELRSLVWKHFPLKSLPSNFIAKNLVELDMQNSLIEHLWEGAKPLENLKIINLTSSPHLKKTPDFTEAKNLEKVVFRSCTSLFEVHPSISSLKNLVLLDLEYCGNLKIFPSKIGMKSLRTLKLSWCENLDKFPEVSDVMQDLSELYLDYTEIKELPSSISNLTRLVTLNLKGCKQFKSLPRRISHMKSLKSLDVSECSKLEKFPEISEVMKKLSELCLDDTAIKELPASILNLTSLVTLSLNDCRELESLPSSISHMKSLSELYLGGTAIKELPASILNLTSLVTLSLNDCRELESLPSSISHMKSLKYLYLEKFPEISEVMKKLFKLYLDGTAIKELPASILNLTSLVTLKLNDCRELESLPSSISHMKSLKYLDVSGCSKLEKFPAISEVMNNLSELYLDGTAIKELPASILNLTRIELDPNYCIIYNTIIGIAYSRHIVQIYSYHGGDNVREHLEIDAHVGGVNDLAFSHPNEQLCVITCGDDKTIKVWDATTGAKQYTFEGQEAPVYSVCPHHKENIQFIFSIALDGKIKAWEYDNLGSRVDYDAPGCWCTTMAYSADGTRLFSCGTSKDGESYIVEWNESEGAVKRTYQGFRKRSFGVVQFNTTKNRFLAAGDDFSIKFWDMDNIQLLTTADADGGLPASPRIRLNKDGTLLAASANENGIIVLANADGMRWM